MEQEAIITVPSEGDKKKDRGFVQIPVCQEDFTEFISSLLGKPQSVSAYFWGSFEFTKNNVEHLYFLIDQRIQQQNDGSLVQFSAKTTYSDHTSITINDLDSFISYKEVKTVIPTAVTLSWIYLIKFPDKRTPEKQEIELSVVTPEMLDVDIQKRGGLVQAEIRYTARTWGTDIEALISANIKELFEEQPKIKKILLNNSGQVGLLIASIILVGSAFACLVVSNQFTNEMVNTVSNHLNSATTVSDKIDYIANHIASGEWIKFNLRSIIFLGIAFVSSIFAGVWVTSCLESIVKPCFILFTEAAERNKIKVNKRNVKKWWVFGASVCVSILSGVAGNYIFQFLTKPK